MLLQTFKMIISRNYFVFVLASSQEVVMSPVQPGEGKPQIDSNQANNYNIVKEVISTSISVKCLFLPFCVSTNDLCVSFIGPAAAH